MLLVLVLKEIRKLTVVFLLFFSRECSKLMVEFHNKAATGKLTGVYRKYSTSKYGYAARSEPAYFLLDSGF